VGEPRIIVTRADRNRVHVKTFGGGNQVVVDDFEYAGTDQVLLEIANDGRGEFEFTITGAEDAPWLHVQPRSGVVAGQQPVIISVDRSLLPVAAKDSNTASITTAEPVIAQLSISGGGAEIPVVVSALPDPIGAYADKLLPKTYLPGVGNVLVIPADGFAARHAAGAAQFEVVTLGGRDGNAIRVFPTTTDFAAAKGDIARPTVTYRALITKPGCYRLEVWQVPTGVVIRGKAMEFTVQVGDQTQVLTAIPADVNAGYPHEPRWAGPVLDNIRVTSTEVELPAGVTEITIGALDANLMLEKLVLYPVDAPPAVSYLGPPNSSVIA